jgi:hypothetical protein
MMRIKTMATTAPLSPKMFTEALLSPSTQPDELAYIHMSVRRKMTVVEHINSFEITVKHAAYLLGADEEEVKRGVNFIKHTYVKDFMPLKYRNIVQLIALKNIVHVNLISHQ